MRKKFLLIGAGVFIIGLLMISSFSVTGLSTNKINDLNNREIESSSSRYVLWDNGLPDGRNALGSYYWPSQGYDHYCVDDIDVPSPGWIVEDAHYRIITHLDDPNDIDAVWIYFFEDIGNEPAYNHYYEDIAYLKVF